MRLIIAAAMIGAFSLGASAAQCRPTIFNPAQLKGPRHGSANQVLVLGTPHLSQLPASFKPADLQPLIARLRGWKPQAIMIEAVSGSQCHFMRHYPGRYRESVETYCWDPAPARIATGLDVPAATAEAARLLASWPPSPSPAQRRHMAAVFLASGEPASALVQWLRLSPSERHSAGNLNPVLTAKLDSLQVRRDESLLIAARLAADLGQERVYAMDDHTADMPVVDEAAYGAAIGKAWDNPATERRKVRGAALEAQLGSPDAIMAMYRAYNAPDQSKLVFDSDFGAALEEKSPQQFGRNYLGYWETRNLRMAANIRDILATRPGIRALVIVGASHKGYLEAYLNQMHDVRITVAEEVLR